MLGDGKIVPAEGAEKLEQGRREVLGALGFGGAGLL